MVTQTTAVVDQQLRSCDDLDFKAFNMQDWELFKKFHAENVAVTYPDGRQATGIEQHAGTMQALFSWAPDLKVASHQVRFGGGEWTTVTGILTGTFSRDMSTPVGTSIEATGKPFKLPMCTVARWENGRIAEKHLFWDNQALMHQIGPVEEVAEESFVVGACD